MAQKRSAPLESGFSSYLKDLRTRSDSLAQTPVKRLKVGVHQQEEGGSHVCLLVLAAS